MKLWVKWVLITLLAICLAAGGYAWYLYHSVKVVIEQTYEPIRATRLEKSELREIKISTQKKDPFSLLILGVDETPGDKGRSDTIIILTINPEKNSTLLFSIPRDTRTELIGRGTMDKINHAYAFGGVEMSVKTVESFLQIPIDYYVKVNMREFVKVIDILGGVQVENQAAFHYEEHSFAKGSLLLNGEEALAYSRMRYDDPRGDLGRNERQRQVVRSLINKGEEPEVLTNIKSIFDNIATSVKTNMTFDELKDLALHYKPTTQHLQVLEIKGSNRLMNGVYYYIVTPEERKRIETLLKEQLDNTNPVHHG
ncbi:LCP family protein [Brevibacillus sp. NRS-1366]|uniref:LCP family glycopolymer transferase n=1 Tax=Brevibacillus sp. NRS-1366 TaxID=3233899 RepID=UPI003D24E046